MLSQCSQCSLWLKLLQAARRRPCRWNPALRPTTRLAGRATRPSAPVPGPSSPPARLYCRRVPSSFPRRRESKPRSVVAHNTPRGTRNRHSSAGVGVGGGHHQPAHAPWVPLPGSGDGLAQPVRAGLAAVQHPGSQLLRPRAGGIPTSGLPPGWREDSCPFPRSVAFQVFALPWGRPLPVRRVYADGIRCVDGGPPLCVI